jgi:transcriptional regulator with XRE-family HTH domain
MSKAQVFSGAKLRAFRERRNLSRFQLARKIDFAVGTATVMRYEDGDSVPNYDVMSRLATALDIKVDDLTEPGDAKG